LLANLDPKRDVSFVEGPIDQLDHGANQALFGGKMAIDGTRKWPEEGYKREWPEVLAMSRDVERRVDERWAELGIGLDPPASRGHSGDNGAPRAGEVAVQRLLRAARVALGREP
jgi:4-hydroxy-3-polyprenylbenzoate decarboxylase